MKQIRVGVFETNSSSTHSLTLCSGEEYEKWVKGEILFEKYSGKFVELSEVVKDVEVKDEVIEEDDVYPEDEEGARYDKDGDRLYTKDEFWDSVDMESFHEEYVTKSGEKVVAFGYYGMDN